MKRPILNFYCKDPADQQNKHKQLSTFFRRWSQPATVQEALQKAKEQNGYELEKQTETELAAVRWFDEQFLISMIYLTEFFREDPFAAQLFKIYKKVYVHRLNTELDDQAFKTLCTISLYTDHRFRPQMSTWQLVRHLDKIIDHFDSEGMPAEALLREFAYHSLAVQPRDSDVFDHPQFTKGDRNEKVWDIYSVVFRYSFTCQAILDEPMGRFFDQMDVFLMGLTESRLYVKDILGGIPEDSIVRVFDEAMFRPDIEPNVQQIIVTWFTANVLSHEILLNEPVKYFHGKRYTETEARHIVGEYRGNTIAYWRGQTAVTSSDSTDPNEDEKVNPAYKRLLSLRHTNEICLRVLFLAGLHTVMKDFINRNEYLFHYPHQTIREPEKMHHLHSIKEYLRKQSKYGVGVVKVKQYYMLFHKDSETEISFGYKTHSIHRAAMLLIVAMLQSLDKRVNDEKDPMMAEDLKNTYNNLKKFFQLNILKSL